MNETDSDVREYVTRKSEDIRRSVVLRKIASLVDSVNREESGKTIVAIGTFLGFVSLIAIYTLVAWWFPGGHAVLVLFVGFFVWIAFVVFLVARFLGKRKQEERPNSSVVGYVVAGTLLVLALFAVGAAHILWGPKGLLFALSLWVGGLFGVVIVWWFGRRSAKPNRRF